MQDAGKIGFAQFAPNRKGAKCRDQDSNGRRSNHETIFQVSSSLLETVSVALAEVTANNEA